MNLQESIRRILREDKDHTNLLKGIIDSSDIFDYKHFCGFDIITPEERSDQYNFLNKNKIPYLIKVYFVGGPNSEVWPRTQAIRNKELDLMEELHEYIKSFVPFNIEMMGAHVNSCDGYKKLMKRKYSTDDLQESIKRILREKSDKVMNMQSKILSQFRKQDQMERNEYSKFVQSEFGGDYERGAKEYAKIKNRNSDDIFGDKKRIREFILINFDFNTFSSKDWENYWLLSQHSDNHPEFQKKALKIIKQNLGEDNEYYEYLHDRISCRESGTQIYGTQNICKKSKMNFQESIRRILREEVERNYIFVRTDDFDNTGTVRELPYDGIHCWCIHEDDFDKYIDELELWGGSRKKVRIVDGENYKKYAINYKMAHDYVMGDSDEIPKLEKFNPDEHIMKFIKQGKKSMLNYVADMKYQIILI